MKDTNTNLLNNEKLNSLLKKIIIFLGFSILAILIILVYSFVNKKKTPPTPSPTPLSNNVEKNLKDSFPLDCTPIDVIFKENYIVFHSKKCNIIKILDPKKNTNDTIKY